MLDRPDPAQPRRQLTYDYRDGWAGPTTSPSMGKAAPVDLARFDAAKAVGILRGAPKTLGINQSDVKSTYLIMESSDDPTAPGAVSATSSSQVTAPFSGSTHRPDVPAKGG